LLEENHHQISPATNINPAAIDIQKVGLKLPMPEKPIVHVFSGS